LEHCAAWNTLRHGILCGRECFAAWSALRHEVQPTTYLEILRSMKYDQIPPFVSKTIFSACACTQAALCVSSNYFRRPKIPKEPQGGEFCFSRFQCENSPRAL